MAVTRVVVTRWSCRCGGLWTSRAAAVDHDREDAKDERAGRAHWKALQKYMRPAPFPFVEVVYPKARH